MKWIKRILLIAIIIPIICIGIGIFYFTILLLFNPWSNIITLDRGYETEALFVNDKYEAIFGYKMPLEKILGPEFDFDKRLQCYESFVYRKNVDNKAWRQTYIGKGEIRKVSYDSHSNTLYAFGIRAKETGEEITFVIYTQDQGSSWNEIQFPEKDYIGFDFSCYGNKYLWTADSVYSFNGIPNRFQPKETPLNFELSGRSTTTDNECNLWIEHGDELVKIGKEPEVLTEVVGKDFYVDSINYNKLDSSIWLIARAKKRDKTILLKRTGRNNYLEIREFPYFLPSALLMEDNTIAIPGVNPDNVISFLSLEKIFYLSKDFGKSWNRDKYFYPSFAREPFFIYNGVIYLNASMGEIKKRKI